MPSSPRKSTNEDQGVVFPFKVKYATIKKGSDVMTPDIIQNHRLETLDDILVERAANSQITPEGRGHLIPLESVENLLDSMSDEEEDELATSSEDATDEDLQIIQKSNDVLIPFYPGWISSGDEEVSTLQWEEENNAVTDTVDEARSFEENSGSFNGGNHLIENQPELNHISKEHRPLLLEPLRKSPSEYPIRFPLETSLGIKSKRAERSSGNLKLNYLKENIKSLSDFRGLDKKTNVTTGKNISKSNSSAKMQKGVSFNEYDNRSRKKEELKFHQLVHSDNGLTIPIRHSVEDFPKKQWDMKSLVEPDISFFDLNIKKNEQRREAFQLPSNGFRLIAFLNNNLNQSDLSSPNESLVTERSDELPLFPLQPKYVTSNNEFNNEYSLQADKFPLYENITYGLGSFKTVSMDNLQNVNTTTKIETFLTNNASDSKTVNKDLHELFLNHSWPVNSSFLFNMGELGLEKRNQFKEVSRRLLEKPMTVESDGVRWTIGIPDDGYTVICRTVSPYRIRTLRPLGPQTIIPSFFGTRTAPASQKDVVTPAGSIHRDNASSHPSDEFGSKNRLPSFSTDKYTDTSKDKTPFDSGTNNIPGPGKNTKLPDGSSNDKTPSDSSGNKIPSSDSNTKIPDIHSNDKIPTDSSGNKIPSPDSYTKIPDIHSNDKIPTDSSGNKIPSHGSNTKIPDIYSNDKIPTDSSGNKIPSSGSNTKIPDIHSNDKIPTDSSGNKIPSSDSYTKIPDIHSNDKIPTDSSGNKIPSSDSYTKIPDIHSNDKIPTDSSGKKIPSSDSNTKIPDIHSNDKIPTDSSGNKIPSPDSYTKIPDIHSNNKIPTDSSGNKIPSSDSNTKIPDIHSNDKIPTDSSGNKIPSPDSYTKIPNIHSNDKIPTDSSGNKIPSHGSNTKIPDIHSNDKIPTDSSGNKIPSSDSYTKIPDIHSNDKIPTDSSGNKIPSSDSNTKIPDIHSNDKIPTDSSSNKIPSPDSYTKIPDIHSNDKIPTDSSGNKIPSSNSNTKIPDIHSNDKIPTDSSGNKIPSPGSNTKIPDIHSNDKIPTDSSGNKIPSSDSNTKIPDIHSNDKIPTDSSGNKIPSSDSNTKIPDIHSNDKIPTDSSGNKIPSPDSYTKIPDIHSNDKIPTDSSGNKIPSPDSNTKIPDIHSNDKIPTDSSGNKIPSSDSNTKIPDIHSNDKIPTDSSGNKIPSPDSNTKIPDIHSNDKIPTDSSGSKIPSSDSNTKIPDGTSNNKIPEGSTNDKISDSSGDKNTKIPDGSSGDKSPSDSNENKTLSPDRNTKMPDSSSNNKFPSDSSGINIPTTENNNKIPDGSSNGRTPSDSSDNKIPTSDRNNKIPDGSSNDKTFPDSSGNKIPGGTSNDKTPSSNKVPSLDKNTTDRSNQYPHPEITTATYLETLLPEFSTVRKPPPDNSNGNTSPDKNNYKNSPPSNDINNKYSTPGISANNTSPSKNSFETITNKYGPLDNLTNKNTPVDGGSKLLQSTIDYAMNTNRVSPPSDVNQNVTLPFDRNLRPDTNTSRNPPADINSNKQVPYTTPLSDYANASKVSIIDINANTGPTVEINTKNNSATDSYDSNNLCSRSPLADYGTTKNPTLANMTLTPIDNNTKNPPADNTIYTNNKTSSNYPCAGSKESTVDGKCPSSDINSIPTSSTESCSKNSIVIIFPFDMNTNQTPSPFSSISCLDTTSTTPLNVNTKCQSSSSSTSIYTTSCLSTTIPNLKACNFSLLDSSSVESTKVPPLTCFKQRNGNYSIEVCLKTKQEKEKESGNSELNKGKLMKIIVLEEPVDNPKRPGLNHSLLLSSATTQSRIGIHTTCRSYMTNPSSTRAVYSAHRCHESSYFFQLPTCRQPESSRPNKTSSNDATRKSTRGVNCKTITNYGKMLRGTSRRPVISIAEELDEALEYPQDYADYYWYLSNGNIFVRNNSKNGVNENKTGKLKQIKTGASKKKYTDLNFTRRSRHYTVQNELQGTKKVSIPQLASTPNDSKFLYNSLLRDLNANIPSDIKKIKQFKKLLAAYKNVDERGKKSPRRRNEVIEITNVQDLLYNNLYDINNKDSTELNKHWTNNYSISEFGGFTGNKNFTTNIERDFQQSKLTSVPNLSVNYPENFVVSEVPPLRNTRTTGFTPRSKSGISLFLENLFHGRKTQKENYIQNSNTIENTAKELRRWRKNALESSWSELKDRKRVLKNRQKEADQDLGLEVDFWKRSYAQPVQGEDAFYRTPQNLQKDLEKFEMKRQEVEEEMGGEPGREKRSYTLKGERQRKPEAPWKRISKAVQGEEQICRTIQPLQKGLEELEIRGQEGEEGLKKEARRQKRSYNFKIEKKRKSEAIEIPRKHISKQGDEEFCRKFQSLQKELEELEKSILSRHRQAEEKNLTLQIRVLVDVVDSASPTESYQLSRRHAIKSKDNTEKAKSEEMLEAVPILVDHDSPLVRDKKAPGNTIRQNRRVNGSLKSRNEDQYGGTLKGTTDITNQTNENLLKNITRLIDNLIENMKGRSGKFALATGSTEASTGKSRSERHVSERLPILLKNKLNSKTNGPFEYLQATRGSHSNPDRAFSGCQNILKVKHNPGGSNNESSKQLHYQFRVHLKSNKSLAPEEYLGRNTRSNTRRKYSRVMQSNLNSNNHDDNDGNRVVLNSRPFQAVKIQKNHKKGKRISTNDSEGRKYYRDLNGGKFHMSTLEPFSSKILHEIWLIENELKHLMTPAPLVGAEKPSLESVHDKQQYLMNNDGNEVDQNREEYSRNMNRLTGSMRKHPIKVWRVKTNNESIVPESLDKTELHSLYEEILYSPRENSSIKQSVENTGNSNIWRETARDIKLHSRPRMKKGRGGMRNFKEKAFLGPKLLLKDHSGDSTDVVFIDELCKMISRSVKNRDSTSTTTKRAGNEAETLTTEVQNLLACEECESVTCETVSNERLLLTVRTEKVCETMVTPPSTLDEVTKITAPSSTSTTQTRVGNESSTTDSSTKSKATRTTKSNESSASNTTTVTKPMESSEFPTSTEKSNTPPKNKTSVTNTSPTKKGTVKHRGVQCHHHYKNHTSHNEHKYTTKKGKVIKTRNRFYWKIISGRFSEPKIIYMINKIK